MHLKRLIHICATVAFMVTGCHAGPAATSPSPDPNSLPKSAAGINWVRYTDSAEAAFSMDVPVGWQIQGGMYRFGYFDVRWMMDARSLDGKVILRIDDPDVPPYVLPGPRTGPAGHPAIKQNQYQMMVDDYREARPYAETYARHRFAGVCTAFAPRTSDWTPSLQQAWHVDPKAKVTQATVAYDCPTSDGPRMVVVYARNTLMPTGGLWAVDPIVSLIATPDAMPLAQSMAQHMMDSWQENPQWKQYQEQMTLRGLNEIRQGFNQFMQQMQAYHQQRQAAMNQQLAGFEARQNAQATQVSGWGETLTGLTDVRDPNTGTKFQIFSGPKSNYYSNGTTTINSNISPGPGFHQLDQVGP